MPEKLSQDSCLTTTLTNLKSKPLLLLLHYSKIILIINSFWANFYYRYKREITEILWKKAIYFAIKFLNFSSDIVFELINVGLSLCCGGVTESFSISYIYLLPHVLLSQLPSRLKGKKQIEMRYHIFGFYIIGMQLNIQTDFSTTSYYMIWDCFK